MTTEAEKRKGTTRNSKMEIFELSEIVCWLRSWRARELGITLFTPPPKAEMLGGGGWVQENEERDKDILSPF